MIRLQQIRNWIGACLYDLTISPFLGLDNRLVLGNLDSERSGHGMNDESIVSKDGMME